MGSTRTREVRPHSLAADQAGPLHMRARQHKLLQSARQGAPGPRGSAPPAGRTLAHDKVQDLRQQALGVAGRVGQQNMPRQRRVRHHHKALRPKAQPEDLAARPTTPALDRDGAQRGAARMASLCPPYRHAVEQRAGRHPGGAARRVTTNRESLLQASRPAIRR